MLGALCRSGGRRRQGSSAFTAVELLIVMLVIGVLIVLTIGMVRAATDHARRTACAGNLAQLAKVLRIYAIDHSGRYPETGAASGLGGCVPLGNEFPDTWDSPGTGLWPQEKTTGNAGNLYLLIRLGLAAPRDFVCPASGDREAFGPASAGRFSFLAYRPGSSMMTAEQQAFLQTNSTRHCSYSYQNSLGHSEIPYHLACSEAAGVHADLSPPDMVILADHNPYTQMRGEGREVLDPQQFPDANSLNHGGEGQNVLYLSGTVVWQTTPFCGPRLDDGTHDNIYLPAAGDVTDPANVPRHARDSYLVP